MICFYILEKKKLTNPHQKFENARNKMLIYVGKLNYSPYASDELFTVVFRDNVQLGDRVSVIWQWTKDASGKTKANATAHGTVNKVSNNGSGDRELELFSDQKDSTYYW